jgi:uncharacterized membrane protein YuzA (DUF378 family)
MDARRLNYVLLGLIGVSMLLLLGGTYGASAVLQSQAKHLNDAKAHSIALDEKQQQLSKALTDIAKYQSLADIAKSIVPQDKDQAQAVGEIVKLAEANGIKLGAITFPSSTLGGKTSATQSQLKAVKGISGVYSLDIAIQSDAASPIKYANFLTFLDGLEHNRRTALVNGISLQPTASDPSTLSFTLNVSEYVKP